PALAEHGHCAAHRPEREDDERRAGDAAEAKCSGAESSDRRALHGHLPSDRSDRVVPAYPPARRSPLASENNDCNAATSFSTSSPGKNGAPMRITRSRQLKTIGKIGTRAPLAMCQKPVRQRLTCFRVPSGVITRNTRGREENS